MPRERVATVVRASFDDATTLGSMAIGSAVAQLRLRGFVVDDLYGDRATKESTFRSIESLDPVLVIGLGHGKENIFTGQNKQVILKTCEYPERIVKGRIIYLVSCLTGASLGPDTVVKGATTFIGYKEEFIWIQERYVNPLNDRIGRSFFEPVYEIIVRLADGETTGSAFRASIDRWNYWINYWARQSDPVAPAVISLLIHDRDSQVLYGSTTAKAVAAPAYAPAPIPSRIALAEAMTALAPVIIPVAGIGIAATGGAKT
jgi:hypothetical protein